MPNTCWVVDRCGAGGGGGRVVVEADGERETGGQLAQVTETMGGRAGARRPSGKCAVSSDE